MERAGNAAILRADSTDHRSLVTISRRGGRAVDCAGLENRKAERPREFESHPLRSIDYQALTATTPPRIMQPYKADAHRDGKRFVVRADDKLTTF